MRSQGGQRSARAAGEAKLNGIRTGARTTGAGRGNDRSIYRGRLPGQAAERGVGQSIKGKVGLKGLQARLAAGSKHSQIEPKHLLRATGQTATGFAE